MISIAIDRRAYSLHYHSVIPFGSFSMKRVLTLHFSRSRTNFSASLSSFKRMIGTESHPKYARIARTFPHEPPAKLNEGVCWSFPIKTKSRATNPDPTQTDCVVSSAALLSV